jgi:hypothetical protein
MTDQASERRQVDAGSDKVLTLQEISTSLIREGNLDALYGGFSTQRSACCPLTWGVSRYSTRSGVNSGCWQIGDFILHQRPSGNGSVSIPLVAVASLCPRGLGS